MIISRDNQLNGIVKYQMKDRLPLGWLQTTIGNLIQLEYGKSLTKKNRNSNGTIPVLGSSGIVDYHDKYLVTEPILIVGRKGGIGEVFISENDCWPIDTTYFIKVPNILSIQFTFYLLKSLRLKQYDKSTTIPGLNRNDVYEIQIKLPPPC